MHISLVLCICTHRTFATHLDTQQLKCNTLKEKEIRLHERSAGNYICTYVHSAHTNVTQLQYAQYLY